MAGEDLKDKQTDTRSIDVEVVEYADSDDLQLELLGYKSEFKRDFTFLGLFSLVSSELAVLPGVAGTIWYAPSSLIPEAVSYDREPGT